MRKTKTHEQWFQAVQDGADDRVAELLAEHPELALAQHDREYDKIALHYAAEGGHDARLLTACPASITAASWGNNALHFAAKNGHEKVFARLLNARPDLIDALSANGSTALHYAARSGNENLVAQISALCPELLTMDTNFCRTPFHSAIESKQQHIAEKMLARNPELAHLITRIGTVLHFVAAVSCDVPIDFVDKLWRMNPQALHHINESGNTPFCTAVHFKKNELIELFQ